MDNALSVINAQGAQVKQLEQQVREQQILITLLASEIKGDSKRFGHKEQQKAEDEIEAVNWKQNKDGTIVVIIKRYRKGN